MPVDPGDACLVPFVLGVELEPDALGVEGEPAAHLALQRLDARAGGGGHDDRAVGVGLEACPLVVGDPIDLVVDAEPRHLVRLDLGQHALDRFDVPLAIGIGGVDDVQQQIGLHDFLERGAERGDQAVRQAIDEADRVRQQDLRPAGQPHLAQQRIERDEQRVRDERFLPRQAVEERRLAGVGVADQRDGRQQAFAAAVAQLRAAGLDVGDLLADDAEPVADVPAIDFELGFTGAPGADAAAEPRQPVARADEPGHQVLELRELDLELALARARPAREDVEDQLRAIERPPARFPSRGCAAAPGSARCRR